MDARRLSYVERHEKTIKQIQLPGNFLGNNRSDMHIFNNLAVAAQVSGLLVSKWRVLMMEVILQVTGQEI